MMIKVFCAGHVLEGKDAISLSSVANMVFT